MKTYTTPSGRVITAADMRPQTREEKLAIAATYYDFDRVAVSKVTIDENTGERTVTK